MPARVSGPARVRTLRERAYETILNGIIFGDLPPSSSIDEKNLARMFGLGLAAVRDALCRLSLEGLAERHPRIGTRIPGLGLQEMQDVFEARVLLEGSCAALAALRASPEQIAGMRSAFAGYESAIRQREFRRLVEMDLAFHGILGAASRNRQIEQQVVLLHKIACRFWYFGLPRLKPELLRDDIAAHLDVVDAIEKRDAGSAEQAMRTVLGHFPESVRVYLAGAMFLNAEQVNGRNESHRRERKRPQKGARTATNLS